MREVEKMLSHEDERRLQAIERQMLDDDPDFVRRFQSSTGDSMWTRRTLIVIGTTVLAALVTLGVVVAIGGLLSASPVLILTGGALATVAGHELRRIRRQS